MKNLLNFFFSFDKLFKEKLVVPFFWLALIVAGLTFFATAFASIWLGPLASVLVFIGFFARVLLALVSIRIISEIFVAIFRINDNVSPDGGKGELADIDPVGEARRAAEAAAARTRELTHSATERAKTIRPTPIVTDSPIKNVEVDSPVMGKGSTPEADDEPTPAKALEPSAVDGAAVRRRGRPKGSKNKPKTTPKTTAETASATAVTKTDDSTEPVKKRGRGRPKGSKNKTTTSSTASTETSKKRGRGRPKGSKNKTTTAADGKAPAKRGPGRPKGSKNTATGTKPGPKKGRPIPRDAEGNLLKKDGTPRKKPGPKASTDTAKMDEKPSDS